jgi:hypothetical protein
MTDDIKLPKLTVPRPAEKPVTSVQPEAAEVKTWYDNCLEACSDTCDPGPR